MSTWQSYIKEYQNYLRLERGLSKNTIENYTFDVEGLGSDTVDMKDDVKSTDFGIGVGMNYEFSDVIFANARYQGGLTEIGDSEAGGNSVKNSVFQIGLGFRF